MYTINIVTRETQAFIVNMYSYNATQGPIYTLKSTFLPPGFKKSFGSRAVCQCKQQNNEV